MKNTTARILRIHRSSNERDLTIPTTGMEQAGEADCVLYADDGQLPAPEAWYGRPTTPTYYCNIDGEFLMHTPARGYGEEARYNALMLWLYNMRQALANYPHTPYQPKDDKLPPCTVIRSHVPTEFAGAFSVWQTIPTWGLGAFMFAAFKHPDEAVRERMTGLYRTGLANARAA